MNTKTKLLTEIESIFDTTESILSDHFTNSNTSYKMPNLVNMVVSKLSFTDIDKAIKMVDPIVRYYIKGSDKWYSVQGLNGGVKPIAMKEKALATKNAKELAKKAIIDEIEAQVEQE